MDNIETGPLVSKYAACCFTTFTARTFDRVDEMHADYHAVQARRGRRTADGDIGVTAHEIGTTIGEFDEDAPEVASALRWLVTVAYRTRTEGSEDGTALRNAAHALVTSFNDFGDATLTGALAAWDEFEAEVADVQHPATRDLLVEASEGEAV